MGTHFLARCATPGLARTSTYFHAVNRGSRTFGSINQASRCIFPTVSSGRLTMSPQVSYPETSTRSERCVRAVR